MKIEDYGMIGDLQTAALVGRNGSVDWLCLPRFDSASVFGALVGEERHGCWRIAPSSEVLRSSRRYRPDTLVLETDLVTAEGTVRLIDFMPHRGAGAPQLVRIVEGIDGRVPMAMSLMLRPDYGSIVPWVERAPDGIVAVAGPDSFRLSTPLLLTSEDGTVTANFMASEGSSDRFVMSWNYSFEAAPPVEDVYSALARTEAAWREWSGRSTYKGAYPGAVMRSVITLKAMTNETTGGIVAAPTTSLPEELGGARNWDYRYCWLRDAAGTLAALTDAGYAEEGYLWGQYVARVATGDPSKLQIMYGVGGERRLTEFELDDFPGYEGSRPVRIGNAASEQFQLDVYGEVAIAMTLSAQLVGPRALRNWSRWLRLVDYVESIWRRPDDGIWETRGPQRQYTFSKVMAWAFFDRSILLADRFELDGPVDHWKEVRDEIHADVCEHGYDPERGTFTQYYGSKELDASVLMVALLGFLPPDDERVTGTIDAVRDGLGRDGFISRYSTAETDDGLPGDEGQFIACSFWLVGALAFNGRVDEARALFERLLDLRNDLGLLAEEYDVHHHRQVGNFPQAFSHMTLVTAARAITLAEQGKASLREAGPP